MIELTFVQCEVVKRVFDAERKTSSESVITKYFVNWLRFVVSSPEVNLPLILACRSSRVGTNRSDCWGSAGALELLKMLGRPVAAGPVLI